MVFRLMHEIHIYMYHEKVLQLIVPSSLSLTHSINSRVCALVKDKVIRGVFYDINIYYFL